MRLLIVDDEEILIDLLQRTLKNYALDAVTDGEQGWIYGSTYPYDLIILDWSLPKLDGLSLCQRFRNHGYHMPILLLTVRNSSPEKIQALDAGADDYLCKPFDVEELAARIRALLRRSNPHSPLLNWGDLQLNPSNCQVIYQGNSILLTAKEYQLLELFMRHSQEVFGIEDILESLWPSVEYISEATVRSHLRNLRKKLKQAGLPEDPIATLRGRGYGLKPLPQYNKSEKNFLPTQPEDKADKQARHLAALSAAWNKYRNKCHQQLTTLEEALEGLKIGYLSPNKREEARLSAHNLAGTLGIFGFDECSQLARELEQLLEKTVREKKGKLLRFETIFNDLVVQLAIEDNPSNKISGRLTKHCPLLLVIDDDRNFTELLSEKALSEGIQIVVVPTPELAISWLEGLQDRLLPNIVLLRLSLVGANTNDKDLEERLSLIAEFNLLVPSIPVIIIADRDHFRDRLLVARHGGAFYLKQPLLPAQVVAFCQQVLESSSWGKKVMIVDDDVEFLQALPDLLEPWGFKLTTLGDPRQFWDVLQAVKPDLLILDIEMPHWSGI
ncbi:MAG: response regulator [Okeania sp. SIO2F4]|uniref:response regulator n=1 Tax=Okeania sp. SIO2F4 TaxID=2607790 RepID=UPI00142A0E53|nr:response regulator [Okeania sp. SIO2F4]NES06936.1 response regulator [Okeania sp. SIO2F4]